MAQVFNYFLIAFFRKSLILGVPAPPCAGLGQGLETGVQKSHFGAKVLTLLGALFRDIRHFLTFHFSVIFEVTSDPIF